MPAKKKVPEASRIIDLLPDFVRDLKAGPRGRGAASPRTIATYTFFVKAFCRAHSPDDDAEHCDVRVDGVSQEMIANYFIDLYETKAPNTVHAAHIALSSFFNFCIRFYELEPGQSPMRFVGRPNPPVELVPVLSDEQIGALLSTCTNRGKDFKSTRDYAILRLFLASGARLQELVNLRLVDIHLDAGTADIHRGKGGSPRVVAFGPIVARALGQYIHLRGKHKHASVGDLWIGVNGKLRYETIRHMVTERASAAHLPGVHAHLFRHRFAHEFQDAEGEGDLLSLMQLGGWKDLRMLRERYGASMAAERAIKKHHQKGVGEHF